jgi:hypothetical protein
MRLAPLYIAIGNALDGRAPWTAPVVDLNPDGLGNVVIYPYYTVDEAPRPRGTRVRFLEGYNSREVLDFNLYLSPQDVWTAHQEPNANE